MEALRKAEEQKRKAEAERKAESQAATGSSAAASGPAAESPAADGSMAAGEPAAASESAASGDRTVVPSWFGRGAQGRKSQIPDVEIGLEEPPPTTTPVVIEEATREPEPEPELELETLSMTEAEPAPAPPTTPNEPAADSTRVAAETDSAKAIPRSPQVAEVKRPSRTQEAPHSPPAMAVDPRRQSARAVFAAKTTMRRQSRNRRLALVGGVAMVSVLGLGGYLALNLGGGGINVTLDNYDPSRQLPPMDTDSVFPPVEVAVVDATIDQAQVEEPLVPTEVSDPGVSPEPLLPAPVAQPFAEPAPVSVAVVESPSVPVETVVEEPLPPAVPTSAVPVDTGAEPATAELAGEDGDTAAEPADGSAEPATAQAPVVLVRRDSRPTLDPSLLSAYAAYQDGDLVTAARLYEEVLIQAPLHRDALLGLATIARLDGDTARARELYSRLLTRDPRDPAARAGLLELAGGNPNAQERELKRLLDLHPQEPTLAFALGNLYAAQQRWPEAQQYYFDALQLARSSATPMGGVNPDYAFNLAVSLEHMSQVQPALTYYQEALVLAASHPAGFDLDMVRSKLRSANQD
ncbi:MAG: hypothetical protein RLZZ385_37 [Pseudomonadota bacterium]